MSTKVTITVEVTGSTGEYPRSMSWEHVSHEGGNDNPRFFADTTKRVVGEAHAKVQQNLQRLVDYERPEPNRG